MDGNDTNYDNCLSGIPGGVGGAGRGRRYQMTITRGDVMNGCARAAVQVLAIGRMLVVMGLQFTLILKTSTLLRTIDFFVLFL